MCIRDRNNTGKYSLIIAHFYRNNNPTEQLPVCETSFWMQTLNVDWKMKSISLILYKDHTIMAGAYSNLYQTNEPLRKLAEVFAYENDFEASLIINDEKKIVENETAIMKLLTGIKEVLQQENQVVTIKKVIREKIEIQEKPLKGQVEEVQGQAREEDLEEDLEVDSKSQT